MIGCFTVGDHTAVVDTRYRESEIGMPQDRRGATIHYIHDSIRITIICSRFDYLSRFFL